MRGGFLDRRRASALMREGGFDALVLAQPETLKWATGAFPGVATFWRRAGAAFLVIPENPDGALTAIVGDLQASAFAGQSGIADVRSHPLWVETARFDASREGGEALISLNGAKPRPGTFSLDRSLELLRDALEEKGLAKARIGLELAFVPAADFPRFSHALPDAAFTDASPLVARLRAIKHPQEIERLGRAARCAMAGLEQLLPALQPGLDASAMTATWRAGWRAAATRLGLSPPDSDWAYIAVGGDGFAPGGGAKDGDLVKIDIGCIVDGYSSDGGRTAAIGAPNRAQREVFDALRAGFDVGVDMLKPGVRLADIHVAVSTAIQDRGFPNYRRGHFGHGVGASVWSEEWPFIAADSDAEALPGMTLAFETPYYVDGLGGFIIEDQFLVGEKSVEPMATAPRDLFIARG